MFFVGCSTSKQACMHALYAKTECTCQSMHADTQAPVRSGLDVSECRHGADTAEDIP